MNKQFISLAFVWFCLGDIIRGQDVFRERLNVFTDRAVYHAGEQLWFSLSVMDADTYQPASLSKVAYLEVLDSVNTPVAQVIIPVKEGHGEGSITLPWLKPGIYMLVAYTSWMKNFNHDLFYRKELVVLNGNLSVSFVTVTKANTVLDLRKTGVHVSTDQQTYGTRRKVRLRIDGTDSSTKASLSVYKMSAPDDVFGVPPRNIEIVGNGESISTEYKYAPEYNGRIVRGRILNAESRMPAAGVNVSLTTIGTASSFYNCISDPDGNIKFELRDSAQYDSIVVKENDEGIYELHIESPFTRHDVGRFSGTFKIDTGNDSSFVERYIDAQVEEIYASETDTLTAKMYNTTSFYGKPDMSYELDDYTRFSKMEEVFREYVAPVAVNKNGDHFLFRIYKPGEHETYDRSPLILLDGYSISDVNKLFQFDPLKVKTVEVVTSRYAYAGAAYDGIVNLKTYRGNLNGYPVDSAATIIRDQPFANHSRFISPDYSTEEKRKSRLPDFRNLLYWKADAFENTVEFYTGDVEGTFVAVVQWISMSGEVSVVSTKFTVRR